MIAPDPSGSPLFSPRYLSRNLSWVDFNQRVLEEGLRPGLLPLDRLKYVSIVSSNFDEFFMVRVAALKRAQKNSGVPGAALDSGRPRTAGRTPSPEAADPREELETISRKIRSIMARQYSALRDEVFPDLARNGLCLVPPEAWTPSQKIYLESFFHRELFPLLTPLRAEAGEPLPSIENFWIYAAFLLERDNGIPGGAGGGKPGENRTESPGPEEKISIIRIPEGLNRVVALPRTGEEEKFDGALLEDLVLAWGDFLYPGYTVRERFIFKINRDADFPVDEGRDENFIEAMEEVLEERETSMVVRMSYSPGSRGLRDYFASRFNLEERDLYEVEGPLNLGNLYDVLRLRGSDRLREKPWKIHPHPAFPEDRPIWDCVREGDILLHLPYQSFEPVVRFFREAAADPQVVSIKTTLYRTSDNSPIIRALELASMTGKHVTAVVELKARFDEKQNISWANRLEKAGVIVVYGLARLKVHVKASLVIRREMDRLRRYVHLSTGNYNDTTAAVYEDISLFTAREEIAYETGLLFNMITGYSEGQAMRRLAIAPMTLKGRLLYLIEREISHSGPGEPGRIMAKMNALSDRDIIDALYRASQAGVEVLLNVRGICLLVPGVPGLSAHIRVVSVVDHYLEHSRICSFANGGDGEVYLSSADWMPRNLERRVELMFPVLDENAKRSVLEILGAYFLDNTHAWNLGPQGSWFRVEGEGEEPFRAQKRFLALAEKAASSGAGEASGLEDKGFVIRRSPPARA